VVLKAPKQEASGELVIHANDIRLRRNDDSTGALSEASLHWMADRMAVLPKKGEALIAPYVRQSYPFNPYPANSPSDTLQNYLDTFDVKRDRPTVNSAKE
jgi:hypothetical protein